MKIKEVEYDDELLALNAPLRVIEACFRTPEDYIGLVVFSRLTTYRYGYVAVPEDHPLFGAYWSASAWPRRIDVHGGVDFTGDHKSHISFFSMSPHWLIGFCSGKPGDACDMDTFVKHGGNLEDFTYSSSNDSVIRTTDYMVGEVLKLSEQLTPGALMEAKLREKRAARKGA